MNIFRQQIGQIGIIRSRNADRWVRLAALCTFPIIVSCSSGKGDSGCPVVCPNLVGMPCNKGLDATATYHYCDPCGTAWRCTLTGTETSEFLVWSASDVACSCISSDGYVDTGSAACTTP